MGDIDPASGKTVCEAGLPKATLLSIGQTFLGTDAGCRQTGFGHIEVHLHQLIWGISL